MCTRLNVAEWQNVPYTPVVPCGSNASPKCRLRMDITAPTTGGPWPLLVLVPGGPSPPDDRYNGTLKPFTTALAGQGAVVMVAGWREGPDWAGGYPTSFRDVACAIGVARKIGPAYGANPDRVTLMGHSTGGWPAAVIGLTPTPFTPTPGSCDSTAGSLRPDLVVVEDGELNEVTQPDQADGLYYVKGFLGGNRKSPPRRVGGGRSIRSCETLPSRRQRHPLPAHPRIRRHHRAASGLRVVSEEDSRRRLPESTCLSPRCHPHRRLVGQIRHRADPEGHDRELKAPTVG